jgi:high affinity sulfate transporter 1
VRPVLAVAARYLPIVQWAPRYERRFLRFDLLAALAVWAIVMPQSLAYSSLAGALPQAGFYAAAAAALAYGLLGTCKEMSVGPSATPAVTAASLVAASSVAPAQAPVMLAALALATGVVMIGAGLLRLGFIADFLSRPVIVGFISGIAIDVIVGQAPKLFGVPAGKGNTFVNLGTLVSNLSDTNWRTLAVGTAALLTVVLLGRFAPALPAALIAVAGSIVASRALDLSEKGVAVVSKMPSTLPSLAWPHVGIHQTALVLGGGTALALVCYSESIGAARTIARRHGYEVDANQELVAIGGGNLLGGLLQGFPTDASLSRSAIADSAGARSSVYGLVVSGMIVATILWLTPLFDGLPQATLGAVVIGAIYRLVDVRGLRRLYRLDPTRDFVLAVVALLGVLTFGALGGLAIAVIASLVAVILNLYRPSVAILGRAREGGADEDLRFRSLERHPEYETFPGLVILRFGGELFFANASYLRAAVRMLVEGAEPPVREVILDASAIPRIDTTSAELLADLVHELEAKGVRVVVARSTHTLRADLERFGLIGPEGPPIEFSYSLSSAVAAYEARG